MKYLISTVVCLGAAVLSLGASAQTYQWKDGSGRTVISDTPPPGNTRGSRSLGAGSPTAAAAAPKTEAAAPKSLAEKDMEFKRRQQEALEKREREAKEETAAAHKRENCERARRQLAALESRQPLLATGDQGEARLLQDAERQHEMERARQIMAESCK